MDSAMYSHIEYDEESLPVLMGPIEKCCSRAMMRAPNKAMSIALVLDTVRDNVKRVIAWTNEGHEPVIPTKRLKADQAMVDFVEEWKSVQENIPHVTPYDADTRKAVPDAIGSITSFSADLSTSSHSSSSSDHEANKDQGTFNPLPYLFDLTSPMVPGGLSIMDSIDSSGVIQAPMGLTMQNQQMTTPPVIPVSEEPSMIGQEMSVMDQICSETLEQVQEESPLSPSLDMAPISGTSHEGGGDLNLISVPEPVTDTASIAVNKFKSIEKMLGEPYDFLKDLSMGDTMEARRQKIVSYIRARRTPKSRNIVAEYLTKRDKSIKNHPKQTPDMCRICLGVIGPSVDVDMRPPCCNRPVCRHCMEVIVSHIPVLGRNRKGPGKSYVTPRCYACMYDYEGEDSANFGIGDIGKLTKTVHKGTTNVVHPEVTGLVDVSTLEQNNDNVFRNNRLYDEENIEDGEEDSGCYLVQSNLTYFAVYFLLLYKFISDDAWKESICKQKAFLDKYNPSC